MRARTAFRLLTAFLAVLAATPALAAKRVALVIGNSSYEAASTLANPANDAAAVARSLEAAGFDEVRLLGDLGQREMLRALRDFSQIVAGSDTAVIYYAGHGVEVGGRNYLIPVDAALAQATDVEFEAVPLENVRTAVSGAAKLRVVILDACRNNPFKLAGGSGSRSVGRGLASIEPGANELVAYAAKEGTVASDGAGGTNSPYAAALVKHLSEPGLDVRLLFGRVRDDVLAATSGQQEPFIYGTLGGQTLPLVEEGRAITVEPAPPPAATTPTTVASARNEAAELWPHAERSGSCEVLQSFIDRYASSDPGLAGFAVAKQRELKCGTATATEPTAPAPAPPPDIAEPELLTLKPAVVRVGKWAEGLAFDGRSFWVAESGQRSIVQIGLDGLITKRMNVGRLPVGMATGGDGSIYTLVHTDGLVWKTADRGRKGKRLTSIKECPQALAASEEAVWVVTWPDCSSATGRVIRVDPVSGRQRQTDGIGEWPQTITTGHGRAWIGHVRGVALTTVDLRSMAVQKLGIEGASVWALTSVRRGIVAGGRIGEDNSQGLIALIDEGSGAELSRLVVSERIAVLASDDSYVAAIGEGGTIWILNAESLALERVARLAIGTFRPSSALIVEDKLVVVAQQHFGEDGAIMSVVGWR